MKKNKIVMSVISGLLVAAVAVGGTLAYLSDTSNQVTNTFNVGTGYIDDDVHQGLWLDEVDITKDDGSRTEKGNDYLDFCLAMKLRRILPSTLPRVLLRAM